MKIADLSYVNDVESSDRLFGGTIVFPKITVPKPSVAVVIDAKVFANIGVNVNVSPDARSGSGNYTLSSGYAAAAAAAASIGPQAIVGISISY